ncbi:nicotinate-nucleotide adenylyltransferase [bacterium LRH843]|nr:nicotinate-nucleotide adenylyltransferase [bacterium LRH843]
MKKVGLFGGTFNPPHLGHLLFAQEAMLACKLDEIWFIPVNIPPHKESEELISNKDRVDLLRACTKQNERFSVSTVELKREGPSYSVDTVKLLKKIHKDTEFFFLIGGDMIDYLPKWERIDELIKLVTFIGVRRPGSLASSTYSDHVMLIDMVQVDFSSTLIRERVRAGLPVTYMVPDEVDKLMKERGLYEPGRSASLR